MVHAAELLKEKRCVKTVAYDIGFKHSSHFSRKFKLRHGMSPAAFLVLSDRQARLANQDQTDGSNQPPTSGIS